MSPTPEHIAWMRRAIELSSRGFPAPNPHVGCVLVRDGEVVGEGWHEYAGGPHAEVNALTAAGDRARGATAFVTLEPCNHTGRTGPCSEALIRAGVREVVVACPDPNPKAAGGAERLRSVGIPTEVGFLAEEAAAANPQFFFAMQHRRPRFVLKAGVSLDGRIALPTGESQWITGPEARAQAHRLRAECGAVLVGRRTVELDNPQLTARIPGVVNPPLRVVLDPNFRLTGQERVFDDQAETWHITGEIDLPALAERLFQHGVTGVLIEGGATTAGHFLRQGLADRLELFVAPKLLGSGPAWLNGLEIPNLAQAPEGVFAQYRPIGPDLWISVDLR